MDEASGQNQEQAAPVVNNVAPEISSERTFRQSEVNELVGRVKHEAVESYKRKLATQSEHAPSPPAQPSAPGQGVSTDEIRRLAAEEIQRQRESWQAETQSKYEQDNAARIVKNFWDKMESGKSKFDDFEQVTGTIKLARFPNVVQLLSEHVENADEVLYELGKNRSKLAQLEHLCSMSPEDAIEESKRLASSIKANVAAGKIRSPNAPLSQQRSSVAGTDTGTTLSIRDLKAKYRG